jgi:serine protease Do
MKALPFAVVILLIPAICLSPAFSQNEKKDEPKKELPKKADAKKDQPKKDEAKKDLPKKSDLAAPPAITKPVPESLADLKAIQDQTKKVLEKVMPCVVGIQIGGASGSGVIVSKDGLILTAGHVSGKPGQKCTIILPDGKRLDGKSLGRNAQIDSGMFQITTAGNYDFCEMGKSDDLKPGSWCIAVGHPNGYQKGRSPVVRVGRVLSLSRFSSSLTTDCTLVGGDSGGPLFDMEGKVIGIHSRIGPTITSNTHVQIKAYTDAWDKLVKGEDIGSGSTAVAASAYLGVTHDDDANDCKLARVTEGSPADKAGLKAGDVISKFDGKDVKTYDDMLALLAKKKPGDEVEVIVKRGSDVKNLQVRLESRGGGVPVPPPMPKAGGAYFGVTRDEDAKDCKLARVTEGSPADKAGLLAGDVITKFDGKDVKTYDEMLLALAGKKPGDEVAVVVKRGDQMKSLKVKLESRN